jgi:hypothetical protein
MVSSRGLRQVATAAAIVTELVDALAVAGLALLAVRVAGGVRSGRARGSVASGRGGSSRSTRLAAVAGGDGPDGWAEGDAGGGRTAGPARIPAASSSGGGGAPAGPTDRTGRPAILCFTPWAADDAEAARTPGWTGRGGRRSLS